MNSSRVGSAMHLPNCHLYSIQLMRHVLQQISGGGFGGKVVKGRIVIKLGGGLITDKVLVPLAICGRKDGNFIAAESTDISLRTLSPSPRKTMRLLQFEMTCFH